MATEVDVRAGTATDREKIAAIRAQLPAIHERVYFNTGTNGPVPQCSQDALLDYAALELHEGRIGPDAYKRAAEARVATRTALAGVLGCDPLEIALTHNTTEGLNMALMGLDWGPGDEVVTATTEHPGGLYPVYLLKQRYGARIRMTGIGLKELDPVAELRKVLGPRTKAVVLSHVSWGTGMVLPMREIADLAHGVGALVIADAAQSCGMVPSSVYELGVDAYACSGQKWLCGPDGTGALFVRRDRLGDIQQTFMGYRGVRMGMSDYEGYFVPAAGAERYEVASLYSPAVRALGASVEWIANDIGWEWVYRRIAALGRYCYAALAGAPGVTLYSPPASMAGLVHFTLDGIAPPDLTARLYERGIIVRYTPFPHVNRVATGFYNTEEEVDRLVGALAEIYKSLKDG